MERKITGFHLDEHNDWVAELDCYHGQHVRHQPPFTNRPWVVSEAGRASKIGATLNCVRCDALEFPDDLIAYKKTPEFTEETIPKGFQKDHSTKVGTWGLLHVLEGALIYTVNYPAITRYEINEGEKAVIAPCLLHSVEPKGKVRFYVEFYSNGSK